MSKKSAKQDKPIRKTIELRDGGGPKPKEKADGAKVVTEKEKGNVQAD